MGSQSHQDGDHNAEHHRSRCLKGHARRLSLADGTHSEFGNDRRGIAQLVKWVDKADQPLVVFEATGAYHRRFEEILGERGIPCNKVNPRHARRFAEANGILAKTDRVDAAMFAPMGDALSLVPREPKPKNLCDLAELLVTRDALVKDQTAAKTAQKDRHVAGDAGIVREASPAAR